MENEQDVDTYRERVAIEVQDEEPETAQKHYHERIQQKEREVKQ